jgi:hypothetical protein
LTIGESARCHRVPSRVQHLNDGFDVLHLLAYAAFTIFPDHPERTLAKVHGPSAKRDFLTFLSEKHLGGSTAMNRKLGAVGSHAVMCNFSGQLRVEK